MRFLMLAVVTMAGCTHADNSAAPATKKVTAPLPENGKAMAPVTAEVVLKPSSAQVTVRFEADGQNVDVGLRGLDGLQVKDFAPLALPQVKRGETRVLDVGFTPGPGRSTLVLNVAGTFNGAQQARVMTFAVGNPVPPVKLPVLNTDEGAVKALPTAK